MAPLATAKSWIQGLKPLAPGRPWKPSWESSTAVVPIHLAPEGTDEDFGYEPLEKRSSSKESTVSGGQSFSRSSSKEGSTWSGPPSLCSSLLLQEVEACSLEEHEEGNERDSLAAPHLLGGVLPTPTKLWLRRNSSQEVVQTPKQLQAIVEERRVKADAARRLCEARDELAARTLSLEDLELQRVIGVGTFAKVMACRIKKGTTSEGGKSGRDPALDMASKNRRDHDEERRPLRAVKVLSKLRVARKMGGTQAQGIEAVCQEVALLRRVQHPCVVNLLHVFQDESRVYLLLDLANGGDLHSLLYKTVKKPLPAACARHLIAQILLGLEELHRCHVLFRDLKPENVLLDHAGQAKLVDFGLAKDLGRDCESRCSTLCGTLDYQAPELLLRKTYGKAADYWALGVLLFELLVNRLPWKYRSTVFETSQSILSRSISWPTGPLGIGNKMDSAGRSLVNALLQDEPTRLQTAHETKHHHFLKEVDFTGILAGRVASPLCKEVLPASVEDLSRLPTFSEVSEDLEKEEDKERQAASPGRRVAADSKAWEEAVNDAWEHGKLPGPAADEDVAAWDCFVMPKRKGRWPSVVSVDEHCRDALNGSTQPQAAWAQQRSRSSPFLAFSNEPAFGRSNSTTSNGSGGRIVQRLRAANVHRARLKRGASLPY